MSKNTIELIVEYERFAQEQRQEGNLPLAGAYYIAAAHGHFMRFRRQPSSIDDKSLKEIMEKEDPLTSPRFHWPTGIGGGIRYLIAGGLCFRLVNERDRCQTCCKQGILFLQDILDHESADMELPTIGLYHEMIGDLRLVGLLGEYEASYDAAYKRYRDADSDLGWSMEDDFDDLMLTVLQLAESVEYEISTETREQVYRTSLEERIRFKRNHYPQIIERVVEAGNWDSEVF